MLSSKLVTLITTLLLLNSISTFAQQCEDVAGWLDSGGDGCAYYATLSGTDDNYYEVEDQGVIKCEVYGNGFPNMGHTAVTACCVCGGGSLYSQCKDITIDDQPWTDAEGDGCDYYETEAIGSDDSYYDDGDTQCSYWGNYGGKNGYTAEQACCFCGGGQRADESQPQPPTPPATPAPTVSDVTPAPVTAVTPAPVAETSAPTPIPSPNGDTPAPVAEVTSAPTVAATDDEVEYCEDVAYWHDKDGESFDCSFYAEYNVCLDDAITANFNMTSVDACCHCGGGYRGDNVPSYAPTGSPAPSVSSTTLSPTSNSTIFNNSTEMPSSFPSQEATAAPSYYPTIKVTTLSPTTSPTTSPTRSPTRSPVQSQALDPGDSGTGTLNIFATLSIAVTAFALLSL